MRNIKNLRSLSHIFSPPVFQKIVRADDFALFQAQVSKHYDVTSYPTNLDIINALYKDLQQKYRCEYVYKNKLMNDILRTHSVKSTVTMNELRIGTSKADLVMLNGAVRAYEIKTELDGLEKLAKQLADYYKFADEVTIVTDERYAQKLSAEYQKTSIGIIALSDQNKLVTVKEASVNNESLHFETIFKLLRKQEYLDLVNDNFGTTPAVPNTKIFRACYELLSSIEVKEFQRQVMNKLKARRLKSSSMLKSAKTPRALKHICNALNLTELEYQKLYKFLSAESVCISHI